jgi:hypothetical protein
LPGAWTVDDRGVTNVTNVMTAVRGVRRGRAMQGWPSESSRSTPLPLVLVSAAVAAAGIVLVKVRDEAPVPTLPGGSRTDQPGLIDPACANQRRNLVRRPDFHPAHHAELLHQEPDERLPLLRRGALEEQLDARGSRQASYDSCVPALGSGPNKHELT